MPLSRRATALPTESSLTAIGLAHRSIDAWLGDPERSAVAQRVAGRKESLRKATIDRVEGVLGHELPAAANRRWLCETVRAWAPLEVLFPSRSYCAASGVTGELTRHLRLILEREYGHIAAGLRSTPKAGEALHADAQRLALELEIGADLRALLDDGDAAAPAGDWLQSYTDMSLAMAEYLHRHVIGLSQVLSDATVMRYTTAIARLQSELRGACRGAQEPRVAQASA